MREDVGTSTQLDARFGAVGTALTEYGIETGATTDLYHRVVASDGGKVTASEPAVVTITRGTLTETEANDRVPESFATYANYPDPFNPATTIRFDVPRRADVSIRVFDALGREVATVIDRPLSPGQHEVRFDASSLASGAYLYRMTAGDFVEVGRMLLVK